MLVDEVREGLLGDGDERHLVGHLEEREAELVGGLDHRLGHRRVGEAGAEAEAGQPVAGEPRDVLALGVGALELEAGGQQQLAARQPRRRIDDLGDVDPADRAVDARLTRHEPDVEVAQEITQGQHGVTDRRPSYADSDKLADRRNGHAAGPSVPARDARLRPHGLGPAAAARARPRLVQGDVAAADPAARARARGGGGRHAGLRGLAAGAAHRRRAGRGAGRVRRRPRPRAAGAWRATRSAARWRW